MWTLIVDAIAQSTWVEQGILLLLVAFSIVSWGLILMKLRALRTARRRNEAFLSLFNQHETIRVGQRPDSDAAKTQFGPMEAVYEAAVATLARDSRLPPEKLHEKVMLNMQHASKEEMAMLRWGSGFLASVGSSSPFIGLLGTVLGIMGTFHVLGKQKTATLNVVGPSISAALIATAAGLFVAIPSVMAYNWVLARVEAIDEETGMFIERMDFLTRTREARGDSSGNGEVATTEAVAAVRGV
jgi:biopolymer transport protein TolQ